MTFSQNRAISALPNVLRDQPVPNTLNGISDPASIVRRGSPLGAFVAGLAVLLVGAAIGLVAVVARTG